MIKRLGNNIYTSPPDSGRKKRNNQSWTVLFGKYLTITTQNLSMVGAGGVLGWYLDKRFDTTPYLLIIGIFAGAVSGFYYLIRSLHILHKKDS